MRAIIIGAGLAMSASAGMTWLEPPFFGPEVSPLGLVSNGTLGLSGDAAWQTWVFLGGFPAAALAVVLALAGPRRRGRTDAVGFGTIMAALAAGLSAPIVLGSAVIRADDLRRDLGLPFTVNLGDIAQSWDLLQDFIRPGLWAYAGGAMLLLIAGLAGLASLAGRR